MGFKRGFGRQTAQEGWRKKQEGGNGVIFYLKHVCVWHTYMVYVHVCIYRERPEDNVWCLAASPSTLFL